jgi:hypothetical protein
MIQTIKNPSTRQFNGLRNQGHYTEAKIESEHELDAALSAWATREGLAVGWADIIGDVRDLVFPVGQIRYLWPAVKPSDA